MYEKVNPAHPDKIADRIAGAIVDLAYKQVETPRIACEVLIGHGRCFVIIETDTTINARDIRQAVKRISGIDVCEIVMTSQDVHLNANQRGAIRCGDNGIFKGTPVTSEQLELTRIAQKLYERCGTDGKYIIDRGDLIICQSNTYDANIIDIVGDKAVINPLGYWTGGTGVDAGATNRKLGSDMGDAVTGGGLHGKDLSKADVSVNIYAHLKAQESKKPFEIFCAIGDEYVDGKPYSEIVDIAREYIQSLGGFEKFAEWGLIRDGK